MSGLYINQLEQLKASKGCELLEADRLDDGKIANMAPPPVTDDGAVKIEPDQDGMIKVTVRKP